MTTVKAREPSIVRTAVALLAAVYAATGAHAVALAGVLWAWWPSPPAADPTPSSTTATIG
jgi:hypothetical protein